MVFSTNQVRQLHVVTGEMTDSQMKTHAAGGTQQNAGSTLLKAFDDWGQHEDPKTFEFFYVNASNELGHSDIIHRENIRKITKTPAAKLRMYLPSFTITLSSNLTKANPTVAGDMEDVNKYYDGDVFYVNFSFPGFLNATDEEVETKTVAMRFNYDKNGNAMLATDPNYDDWGAQMVEAITLAFNGRHNLDNDLLSATGTGTTVNIKGKPGQPWYLGVADNKPNQIVIDNLTWENLHNPALSTLPLENNSNVSIYGTAADTTGTGTTAGVDYIGNGKLTADLEYFCMGERGDQYRNVGWPNVIYTKYMINDTDKEYDYLDIHYYFQGEGVRSDKSEKLLTLVAESGTTYLDDFLTVLCNSNGMLDVTEQNTVPSNTPEDTTTPEPPEPDTEPSITVTLDEPTFDAATDEVSLSASVTATDTTVTGVTFVYDTANDFSTSQSIAGSLNSNTDKYEATLTGLSANTYYVKATATDGTLTIESFVQQVEVS